MPKSKSTCNVYLRGESASWTSQSRTGWSSVSSRTGWSSVSSRTGWPSVSSRPVSAPGLPGQWTVSAPALCQLQDWLAQCQLQPCVSSRTGWSTVSSSPVSAPGLAGPVSAPGLAGPVSAPAQCQLQDWLAQCQLQDWLALCQLQPCVSSRTGWPSVSMLGLVETTSLISSLYLSVAIRKTVEADSPLRYTLHVDLDFGKEQTRRIRDKIQVLLGEEQAGFHPGRSCMEQMATLEIKREECLEWQTPLTVNFVNIQKAFNKIHGESLWNVLAEYGISQKIHQHNNISLQRLQML